MKYRVLSLTIILGLLGCNPTEPVNPVQAPMPPKQVNTAPAAKPAETIVPAPVQADVPLYENSTLFYGVYLNSHKTGWMKVEMLSSESSRRR